MGASTAIPGDEAEQGSRLIFVGASGFAASPKFCSPATGAVNSQYITPIAVAEVDRTHLFTSGS